MKFTVLNNYGEVIAQFPAREYVDIFIERIDIPIEVYEMGTLIIRFKG